VQAVCLLPGSRGDFTYLGQRNKTPKNNQFSGHFFVWGRHIVHIAIIVAAVNIARRPTKTTKMSTKRDLGEVWPRL
jgi:hypothetical protein